MSNLNCRIGKTIVYINKKAYWCTSFAMACQMKRDLDPSYGVQIKKPKQELTPSK